jgi:DNA repair protein RadA/Sms
MEGRRALVTEVQALLGAVVQGSPRRTVSGLDGPRLNMVLAVLQRRLGARLHEREVFAATVGGIKVMEPAIDLAVGLAIASAVNDLAIPHDVVAFGEVGLTGEIRTVGAVPRRLAEAARLGFKFALVPPGCGPKSTGVAAPGIAVSEVGDLAAAVRQAATLSTVVPEDLMNINS